VSHRSSSRKVPALPFASIAADLSSLAETRSERARRKEEAGSAAATLASDLTCLFSIIFITKAPLLLMARHYAVFRAEHPAAPLNLLSAIKKTGFTGVSYRARDRHFTRETSRIKLRTYACRRACASCTHRHNFTAADFSLAYSFLLPHLHPRR